MQIFYKESLLTRCFSATDQLAADFWVAGLSVEAHQFLIAMQAERNRAPLRSMHGKCFQLLSRLFR